MKSRSFAASVVLAMIAALAVVGTTLANHGQGTPRKALFTVLTGHNEIGMTTHKRDAGDLDGLGSATVLVASTDTVCFGITVSRIAKPVAAHIHKGGRSENGMIRVTLKPPTSGNPGASSGCVKGLPTSLVTEIRQHPNRFYVNVHTTEFSGGAIRGQL